MTAAILHRTSRKWFATTAFSATSYLFFLVSCAGPQDAVEGEHRDAGRLGASDSGPPSDGDVPIGDGGVEIEDGTRIRVEYLVSQDGPTMISGFYDKELGVSCTFQMAMDGRLRCLPTTWATTEHFDLSQRTWLPAARGSKDCAPRYIAKVTTPEFSCARPETRVYLAGSTRQAICSSQAGGLCNFEEVPFDEPNGTFHVAGEEVPPEHFVEARLRMQGQGQLRAQVLETADGLQVPYGFTDVDYGPCTFRLTADGSYRCLPSASGHGSAFLPDPPRWVPYVEGHITCPPSTVSATQASSVFSCEGITSSAFTMGDQADYVCIQERNGRCATLLGLPGDIEGATYYLGGASIDPAVFVAGTLKRTDSGKRLHRLQVTTSEGLEAMIGLYDDDLELTCRFVAGDDGRQHCLPDTYVTGGGFIDGRWRAYLAGNTMCAPHFMTQFEAVSPFSCETTRARVYEVGDGVPRVCIQTTNGQCSSYREVPIDAPEGASFLPEGEEFPRSQFVGGTVVRE